MTYDCTGGEGGTPSVVCLVLSQPLDALDSLPWTYQKY